MIYERIIKWCERRKEKQKEKIEKKKLKRKKERSVERESLEESILDLQFQIDDIRLRMGLSEGKCKIEGCENISFKFGKCQVHYTLAVGGKCTVVGCEIDAYGHTELCRAHHVRKHRHGDPLIKYDTNKNRICGLVYCNNSHYAGGYCSTHYPFGEGRPIGEGNPIGDLTERGNRMREARDAGLI